VDKQYCKGSLLFYLHFKMFSIIKGSKAQVVKPQQPQTFRRQTPAFTKPIRRISYDPRYPAIQQKQEPIPP
jgi:hypothetical protein